MWIIKEEEEAAAIAVAKKKKMTATTAKEEAMAAADEGNGAPAMDVCLCGGHVSFGHDNGGPAMEVMWWSEEKRVVRWMRTFERWEITWER